MLQASDEGLTARSPNGEGSGDLLERSPGVEASDDAVLVTAARAGDQDAFRVLYHRYQSDARREALRRGASQAAADDAVSAAFASVFRVLAVGGGPDTLLRPYLLKAVRNAVIDQSRRAKVRPTLEPLNDMEVADPKGLAIEVMGRRMTSALATLPQRQRRALWATEVEGRSPSEMADELQLSTNGFAALKKRARQNLAVAYAAQVTGGDTCTWVTAHVRRYVDGALSTNDALLVELHVSTCSVCASVVPQRDRVQVPVLLLPLLLAGSAMRTAAPSALYHGVSRRLHRLVHVVRGAGAAGLLALPVGVMIVQSVKIDDSDRSSTVLAASAGANEHVVGADPAPTISVLASVAQVSVESAAGGQPALPTAASVDAAEPDAPTSSTKVDPPAPPEALSPPASPATTDTVPIVNAPPPPAAATTTTASATTTTVPQFVTPNSWQVQAPSTTAPPLVISVFPAPTTTTPRSFRR